MNPLVRTARIAGSFYLAFIVLDILSSLLLYVHLSRDGSDIVEGLQSVAVRVLLVGVDVLVTVWLYRLFRGADRRAAIGIVVCGLGTVTVMLILLAQRLRQPLTAYPFLPVELSASDYILVTAGGIFEALWLVLIGRCILRSGWMPRPLGLLLIACGAASAVETALLFVSPEPPVLEHVVIGLFIVAETWFIGYLLIRGVRPGAGEDPEPDPELEAEVSGR